MKKSNILIILSLLLLLTACNSIKEYTGTKIVKITHTSIDYMGGYTVKDELDFIENKYSSLEFMLTEVENPQLEVKSTFSDEEEKVFMNECYTYGLFDLKELYQSEFPVYDGGGWTLSVEYEDGTTKTSRGVNSVPTNVFSKCAIAFYDLCGQGIVGIVPEFYITPPNISYSFSFIEDTTQVNTNAIAKVIRANYKWNKNESLDNNYYLINEEIKDANEFYSNYAYKLVLYTANYECDEKFNNITIKEYDYNSELTNERIIFTGEWFDRIELDIKIHKIYIYELSFKNGDYVQYTFNTYCNR